MEKESDLRHIESLDLLRALAILLVFAFHSQQLLVPGFILTDEDYGSFWLDEEIGLRRIIWNLSPSAFGFSGVELFLLISGFLIHYAFLARGVELNRVAFFNRRFWRIYPPYALALTFFILTVGYGGTKDLLLHGLLAHNLNDETFFSINPSFWSLALEAQLYLAYPFLLLLRGRIGMEKTMWLLAALSLAMTIGITYHGLKSISLGTSILRFWVIWSAGAFIAERFMSRRPLFRSHMVWLLLVGVSIPLSRLTVLYAPIAIYLLTLFHAVLLEYVLLRGERRHRPNRPRALLHRIVVLVGISSYSLYLYHQPVIKWLYGCLQLQDLPGGGLLEASLCFIMIATMTYFVYRWVELPSIQFGKHFYKVILAKRRAKAQNEAPSK